MSILSEVRGWPRNSDAVAQSHTRRRMTLRDMIVIRRCIAPRNDQWVATDLSPSRQGSETSYRKKWRLSFNFQFISACSRLPTAQPPENTPLAYPQRATMPGKIKGGGKNSSTSKSDDSERVDDGPRVDGVPGSS